MNSVEEEVITVKVKVDHLRDDFNLHRQEDVENFGKINSSLEELKTAKTKITTQLWMVGMFLTLSIPAVMTIVKIYFN